MRKLLIWVSLMDFININKIKSRQEDYSFKGFHGFTLAGKGVGR
jgi:hypothetical protein